VAEAVSAAVYAASARERRGIADLLDGLGAAQLDTPSLCAGWSVRTVAGHLVAAVSPSKRPFLVELLRHRGNPHATNTALARRFAALPVAEPGCASTPRARSRPLSWVPGVR
jgi:uncharacterized protein (TIGR03083 family)